MSEQTRYVPPGADFDPRLGDEHARRPATPRVASDEVYEVAGRPDPFNGYLRMRTPQGGILILYKDQYRSLPLTILRVAAWIAATGIGGWLIFYESSLSGLQCLLAFALLTVVNGLIV